jgi:hypothetical protein
MLKFSQSFARKIVREATSTPHVGTLMTVQTGLSAWMQTLTILASSAKKHCKQS